jgi:protein SCO1/2
MRQFACAPYAVFGLLLLTPAFGVAADPAPVPSSAPLPAMQLEPGLVFYDQHGRVVKADALLGKPTLLYFGYTFCPEVCPTTLAAMTQWMKMLGPDADRVNFVFVTIDPQRDTPKALRQFLSDFDPRIRGLTGSQTAIDTVTGAFQVYVKKVAFSGGDYAMDHSTSAFLLDKTGRFVEAFKYNVPNSQAVSQIRYMLQVYG